jgi:hypothetical protein
MTPDTQLQFIAALLHGGDLSTPRRLGIEPTFLNHVPASQALHLIYEYADLPENLGRPPGWAYLQERLVQIPAYDPSSGDVQALCTTVRLAMLRTRLATFAQELARAAVQNPVEAFSRLQDFSSDSAVVSLVSSGESSSLAYDYSNIVQDYADTLHTHGVTGEETPFPTLTQSIKGWKRGGLYVMYAPAKNYKTFVALAAIKVLYLRRRRTLIVSSEMTHRQINERLVCMILGLDFNHFLNRTLPSEVWEGIQDEVETFEARASTTIHHYSPSGLGAKAVGEVKAKIRELNADGQLALVLWDGHYRSAKSDAWEDVYDLTRRTRAIPLDPTTGQVPMLLTTQAGSKRGEVAYRVYEQEASVLMQLEKEAPGQAVLWTKAIRQGLGCRIRLAINLTEGTITEVAQLQEQDDDNSSVVIF